MVSKLFAVSLALAAASALGQQTQCQLSTGGTAIVADITTLSNDNSNLVENLNEWGGDTTSDAFYNIVNLAQAVIADVNTVANAFASNSAPSDCDITTVIGALNTTAPIIVNALDGLASKYSDFNNNGAGVMTTVTGDLDNLAQNTVALLTNAYVWLPCDVVGQTFDAVDSITYALAQCQTAFSLSDTAVPAKPQTCGGSAPACKKQVSKV
ncbi:hypothetical protein TRVA0_048S00518 [Trichomonascus vanleenenianus]|uniref:cell wall mannoprotein 1 family protein n=1 Tax=Trichomonascus vanleenenianus TaxID=2268995 RepID=UPI003ECB124C